MALLIIITGILVRLIGITRPLLGNFSTKGIGYAMVARNFAEDQTTFLYPTFNMIMAGKRSIHMTEWPMPSYLVGAVHKYLPILSIDIAGRILSVVLFSVSAYALYLLVKKLINRTVACYSLLFYSFFPLGIIYGQSFQLEAAMMFTITSSFLLIYQWMEGNRTFLRAFSIWALLSMLLLMKIQMLCLALPAAAMLFADNRGKLLLKSHWVWIFVLSSLVLPFLWYLHTITVAASYDNVFFSILYSVKTRVFPDTRLFTLGFYVQVLKTLIKDTYSPVGFVLVASGIGFLFKTVKTIRFMVFAYLLAMVVYFVALPRKVYEMNYYFMPLLFPGSILAALSLAKINTLFLRRTVVTLFLAISIIIAYNPSFKTPEGEAMIIKAAGKAKEYISPGSRVIVTSRGPDIALLYYTGADGWTLSVSGSGLTDAEKAARKDLGLSVEEDEVMLLDRYVGEGASFYVCDDVIYLKTKSPELYSLLKKKYKVLFEDDIILCDLRTGK